MLNENVTQAVPNFTIGSIAGSPVDGVDCVQNISTDAIGGTYTLTFTNPITGESATTTAIGFDDGSGHIEDALISLSNIPVDSVEVTGDIGSGASVTFVGSLSGLEIPLLVSDNSNLESDQEAEDPATVTIAYTTEGVEGTDRGSAKGKLLVDSESATLYKNSGTPEKPEWSSVGGSSTIPATGEEIDTGTDNVKVVTPAGLAQSAYVERRLASILIDLNLGVKQELYTVPVGKQCVITKVVGRRGTSGLDSVDGSGSFGFNAGADDYGAVSTDAITNLGNPALAWIFTKAKDSAALNPFAVGNAGDVFGFGYGGTPIVAGFTADVFGYLAEGE